MTEQGRTFATTAGQSAIIPSKEFHKMKLKSVLNILPGTLSYYKDDS
jgi:hypothetical protein